MNYEGSLSYEDLAVMLGKEKSTIRGQINTIRQKSEGLIEESVEKMVKREYPYLKKLKENCLKELKWG